jgi:hypothetical protein
MGISLTDYQDLLGKVRGTQLVYLEDMSGDEGDDDYLDRHVADDANPLAMLQDQRMREALVEAIKPARARAVRDEHVLRARHEPEGDRRRAGRDREPGLPAAQPEHRSGCAAVHSIPLQIVALRASQLWQLRHSRESLAFMVAHTCSASSARLASNFSVVSMVPRM